MVREVAVLVEAMDIFLQVILEIFKRLKFIIAFNLFRCLFTNVYKQKIYYDYSIVLNHNEKILLRWDERA
jgi:hypothetical protein